MRNSYRDSGRKHLRGASALAALAVITIAVPQAPAWAQAPAATAAPTAAESPFPLVVLTYPATISEAAFERLKEAYGRSKLGFGCSNPLFKCPREDAAFETSLAKTAYLVQDVHAALQAQLPAGSVVLQPGSIDTSPTGQLVYSVPDPELPAAVRVDFLAYVNPVTSGNDPDHATTYGRRVAPVFAVSANQMGHGGGTLLAATKGLDGAADQVSQQPSTLIQLFRAVNAKADKRKLGKPKATLKYGALKTSQPAWDAHVAGNQSAAPLAADILTPVIAPIVQYAKDPKLAAAAQGGIGRYNALYAEQAAKDPAKAAELLPAFMKAEKQYLASTGVEFVAGLRKGKFGNAMRQRLTAEAEHSASANRTSLLSTLAAGVAGGAMGASSIGSQMMTMVSLNNELNKLSRGYSVPFGELAVGQTTVVMNIGSAEKSLKAASLEELRQGFREILDPPPPPPSPKAKKATKAKRKKKR